MTLFTRARVAWKFYSLYHHYCKYRLNMLVPGAQKVIDEYSEKTDSTGTKYPTLYRAVSKILTNKPNWILESGTGTSTLVLAEAVLRVKKSDPNFKCKIVSMESVPKWFEMAKNLLPAKYNELVEIRLGQRELFEYSMFRGYAHSNIPEHPYDFVFLDGPSYADDKGATTCMDAIKVRCMSGQISISCIIDTRVSSVLMMQTIFGTGIVKYFPFHRTCSFEMPPLKSNPGISSENFSSGLNGRLRLRKDTFLS